MRVGNSAIISRLSTSAPNVWPGGAPTPTNDAVVGWTASSATAPYCGDALAAEKISALLDEIGPAVLLAHSAGGGSTFRVPDLNPEKVVGIIGFEAAGEQSDNGGVQQQPGADHDVEDGACVAGERSQPSTRTAARCKAIGRAASSTTRICPSCSSRRRWARRARAAIECGAAVWQQAGAKASAVYLPDRGLKGGGHFAMAQLDNAAYAKVFIELATAIDSAAKN